MVQVDRPAERRVYLRGVALPLPIAEALIADAILHGGGVGDALVRALRDGRFTSPARAPRTPGAAR